MFDPFDKCKFDIHAPFSSVSMQPMHQLTADCVCLLPDAEHVMYRQFSELFAENSSQLQPTITTLEC